MPLDRFKHGGNVHKIIRERAVKRSNILDFSANINPLGLSPMGKRAIKKGLKHILDYPDPDYNRLKSDLAQLYSTKEEFILPGNGAIELIYHLIRLKKRGVAYIPAPGFVEYERALEMENWEIKLYKHIDEINVEETDLIFICNPNNPTGRGYRRKHLLTLLELCKVHGTDVVIDEAFIDYSSDGSLTPYIMEFSTLYILKSLTKFFAVPGLRIGALLTSDRDIIERFWSRFIPWTINTLASIYITHAIKDKRYIERSKEYIRRERYQQYKRLSQIEDINVLRSQGNYLFFRLNRDINLQSILLDRNIMIRSCDNYNGLGRDYYRVAVKKHRYNKRFIKILKSILG